MALLSSVVQVGLESTYNTFASPTRAYEGMVDNFTRDQTFLESVGFRAGLETVRDDRTKAVMLGGSGSLELDFMRHGMGLLLQGMIGTVSGPTQVAATTAYTQDHATASADPGNSFTIQWLRSVTDGSTQVFTYTGCTVTGWSLSQGTDGFLKINIDFDFANENTTDAAATPVYVTTTPFCFVEASVEIDTSAIENVTELDFASTVATKTDRRYLRNSAVKKQPRRNGVPEYTGNLTVDFDSTTMYDDFVANTHRQLTFRWIGATDEIESGQTFEVTLDMPVVELRGDTPNVSLSDLTMQPVPFKVLHDGTNPAYTLSLKSTDTAL